MQKYNPKSENKWLKWLHVIVFNIKANVESVYHGLERAYLQRYLDEFCYRFNRRHSRKPLLDHLLVCIAWSRYKTVVELCINHLTVLFIIFKYIRYSKMQWLNLRFNRLLNILLNIIAINANPLAFCVINCCIYGS